MVLTYFCVTVCVCVCVYVYEQVLRRPENCKVIWECTSLDGAAPATLATLPIVYMGPHNTTNPSSHPTTHDMQAVATDIATAAVTAATPNTAAATTTPLSQRATVSDTAATVTALQTLLHNALHSLQLVLVGGYTSADMVARGDKDKGVGVVEDGFEHGRVLFGMVVRTTRVLLLQLAASFRRDAVQRLKQPATPAVSEGASGEGQEAHDVGLVTKLARAALFSLYWATASVPATQTQVRELTAYSSSGAHSEALHSECHTLPFPVHRYRYTCMNTRPQHIAHNILGGALGSAYHAGIAI